MRSFLLAMTLCLAPAAARADAVDDAPAAVDGFVLDKRALRAFYAAAETSAVWIAAPARAEEAVEALGRSFDDGLRPNDYAVVALSRRLADGRGDEPATEWLLSAALLRFVADMKNGRPGPRTADPALFAYPLDADAPRLLAAAVTAPSLRKALAALAPQAPAYRRLRDSLAAYRRIRDAGGYAPVPAGRTLKQGDRGPRVAALRRRLAAEEYLTVAQGDQFDAEAAAALRRFQANHGLAVDGVAGRRTFAMLNETVDHHIGDLIVNLERWRWLPDDLGRRHVIVNIAGFDARAFDAGRETLRMRAIVGKPARMTPVFSSVVTDLLFQPAWYVPERIAREDLLPRLRAHPGLLAEDGFTVLRREGGRLVEAAAPDWRAVQALEPFPYVLRQAPGPRNALGRVRFSIRNDWDIYMHGTPAEHLFGTPDRAYSSGCIRLERPLDMAVWLLKETPGYDAEKVDALYYKDAVDPAAPPVRVVPAAPVPVHVVYWTAWADEDGSVHFVDDVYGRDAALKAALQIEP